MSVNYGSKRTVVGAHYGIRDWLVQRVTGVIILIWVLAMLVRFVVASDMSFAGWNAFMSGAVMKTLTLFTIFAVAYHAWIGVRDIWMDYIKCPAQRLALHLFTILWLVGCVVYSLAAVLAI